MFRHTPYQRLLNPAFVLVVLFLGLVSFMYWDKAVAEFFVNFSKYDFHISYIIHRAFKGGVVLGAILLFTFVAALDKRHPKWLSYMLILLVIFLLENTLAYFLKNLLGRSRPLLWIHEHIYGFFISHHGHDYTSFPSGHTVNMMLLTGYFARIFKKYSVAIFVLGLFGSFSRVWGDYHYLSDWFVTAYFAIVLIPVILYLVEKLPNFKFLKRIKEGATLLTH